MPAWSSYSPEQRGRRRRSLRPARHALLNSPVLLQQFNRWIEKGLLDVLKEEGMGSIVFCPLAQGF